jgi:hypothetical protein
MKKCFTLVSLLSLLLLLEIGKTSAGSETTGNLKIMGLLFTSGLATLSVPRFGFSAVSANGIAFFAGGVTSDGTVVDTVDIFDGQTWTTATLSQVCCIIYYTVILSVVAITTNIIMSLDFIWLRQLDAMTRRCSLQEE